MKEIKLNKGKVALVSDEDFNYLNQFKWWVEKGYSTLYSVMKNKGKKIQMHRVILNITDSNLFGDHIDHNGLNNQRQNLRVATHSQNMANRKKDYNSLSKYLGLVWQQSHKSWRARIQKGGKQIHLGYFKNEVEAALAYNKAAKELHGEFANLNVIETGANIHSATSEAIMLKS